MLLRLAIVGWDHCKNPTRVSAATKENSRRWCFRIHKIVRFLEQFFCCRLGDGCPLRRSNPNRSVYQAVPFYWARRQGPSMRMVPRPLHWYWCCHPNVSTPRMMASSRSSFSGGGLHAHVSFACLFLQREALLGRVGTSRPPASPSTFSCLRWMGMVKICFLVMVAAARIVKSAWSPQLDCPSAAGGCTFSLCACVRMTSRFGDSWAAETSDLSDSVTRGPVDRQLETRIPFGVM